MTQRIKQNKPREATLLRREVRALLYLGLGFFVSLSLLSYSPLDPSLNNLTSVADIHNWAGIVGAYLADGLIFLFGGGAYFLGFFLVLVSLLMFVGLRDGFHLYEGGLYLLFVIFISVIFEMSLGDFRLKLEEVAAGGLLGGILSGVGVKYLGRAGTYLLVFFGALLTFVWATHISLHKMSLWMVKVLSPLGPWLVQKGVVYLARMVKWLKKSWGMFAAWYRKKAQPHTPFSLVNVSSPRISANIGPPKMDIPASLNGVRSFQSVGISHPSGEDTGPKIRERVEGKMGRRVSPQLELKNMDQGYQLPSVNLLDSENHLVIPVEEESLKMNARLLEKKLLDFSVEGKVTEIHPGPVVTMYEFEPAPGVKLSRIANLVDDLSLAMGGRSVRIVAPLPNKPAVGIEIPNRTIETVWLKDIVANDQFQKSESRLLLALGKDIEGLPFFADLSKMPHLLVAGATGAGKSVSINAMILSILYKAKPEEVRMIMVDPKMLELSLYEGIPHLLLPVVTEPKKAALALRWAVREMERRYKLLADINARSIANYNRKIEKGDYTSKQLALNAEQLASHQEEPLRHEGKLPYIVIIIDELADLMMVSSREVEESITRLAQMARASGIHLILATQRPSVDVITGVIKANFPARISFKVSSKHDARTVLDTIGSERLLGAGDMLFLPPGGGKMTRVHGAFITESEVVRVVGQIKALGKPVYDESIIKPLESDLTDVDGDEEADSLYDQAVALVAETKQASISMVQRKLRIGYNRAARLIEKMESDGIVSPPSSAGQRQVLVSSFDMSP